MKPHKGAINLWTKQRFEGGRYIVWGYSDGHPQFDGKYFHTSEVLSHVGNEIETLNSRYTLGEEYVVAKDKFLNSSVRSKPDDGV